MSSTSNVSPEIRDDRLVPLFMAICVPALVVTSLIVKESVITKSLNEPPALQKENNNTSIIVFSSYLINCCDLIFFIPYVVEKLGGKFC